MQESKALNSTYLVKSLDLLRSVFNKEHHIQLKVTYRQNEAVLEVGEVFVAFLTSVHAVLLVHHFFVAILTWTGLVQTVLFSQVHDGS